MAARKRIARTTTKYVSTKVGDRFITLWPGESYVIKKQIYSAIAKLRRGTLVADSDYCGFHVMQNGTLKPTIKNLKIG